MVSRVGPVEILEFDTMRVRIGDSHVYRPNEIVPVSGKYTLISIAGQKTEDVVTCEAGQRFPELKPFHSGFLLVEQPDNK
ncbi:MAG TPA: hypothetical protein V6D06_13425 [Trichocoleus sp.]